MKQQSKTVSASRTEQVHILMPMEINGQNRLFGGILMQWIDVVAAVVARRHSGRNVTTAFVDSLAFLAPAHINDTIAMVGKITYAGKTSMEINVDTFVEELDGTRRLVNRAFLVMVAIDEKNRPQEVPSLSLESDQERSEWEDAKKRRELRKHRRTENF